MITGSSFLYCASLLLWICTNREQGMGSGSYPRSNFVLTILLAKSYQRRSKENIPVCFILNNRFFLNNKVTSEVSNFLKVSLKIAKEILNKNRRLFNCTHFRSSNYRNSHAVTNSFYRISELENVAAAC